MSVTKSVQEVKKQIRAGLILGAVFGTAGHSLSALGKQTLQPQERPMTINSRFDIASVGKVFTASCCALLVTQGKLDPDAPFTEYLPEHGLGRNCKITVRDLATHTSGIDSSGFYKSTDPIEMERRIMNITSVRPAGERFEYNCRNFILLGWILEHITGKGLEDLARDLIWKPLEMNHTVWNAPGAGPDEVEHFLPNRPPGQHNDNDCFVAGRPLGNGSCFSTAGDLLLFLQDILAREHFAQEYYDLISTCTYEKDGSRRSFGWDMCERRRPRCLSEQTICHSGFTGQTVCVDPVVGFAAVVLTNRTGDWEQANQARIGLIEMMYRANCRKGGR